MVSVASVSKHAPRVVDLAAVSKRLSGRCRAEGAQLEPDIALDPRAPRRMVVAWMNDVGLTLDVSQDAGRSWHAVATPRLTRCSHGPYVDAFDPGLSYGPDGTAYLSVVGARSYTPCRFAILVMRAPDGGAHWSSPATVAPADGCNDKQRGPVVADPMSARRLYSTWVDYPGSASAEIHLSTSADGGRRWSAPSVLYAAPPGRFPDFCELHTLRDGALLATFIQLHSTFEASNPGERWEVLASRSRDRGRTWSRPIEVATTSAELPRDPRRSGARAAAIRAIVRPSAAVAPDGAVFVAWQDVEYPSASSIMIARSDDGGTSWSRPHAASRGRAESFQPALAVDERGTVGITYYSMRPGTRNGRLETDVWLLRSRDGGRRFGKSHVAGPFDYGRAQLSTDVVRGRFLGDYFGLAALRRGFVGAFAQARPAARKYDSDIFFAGLAR